MNKNNDTGVSETIGFVLILGIVITGIGIVTLYGYPALLQQQENANIKNMEKNMIVLQNDVKLLAYKSVPYRETTMQITGGYIQVIPPNPTPNLPGNSHFDISSSVFSDRYYPGLLQFNSTSVNEIIALQNGAIVTNGFSDIGSGSTMLSEPRWFLDTDLEGKKTLVISIININSNGAVSTSSGIGTVQINISSGDPIDKNISPLGRLQFNIGTSGRVIKSAWRNYFNNQLAFPGSSVDNTNIILTVNSVDRLVIKTYNVTVLNL